MSEQTIEQEIIDKGLNSPRITPKRIDEVIASEYYFTAGNGIEGVKNSPSCAYEKSLDTLTFCVLVLQNGFTVTGESACASPENFDVEIGKKIAYENARNKIWPLEGYLLKNAIHSE